jgi:hypothetical protein
MEITVMAIKIPPVSTMPMDDPIADARMFLPKLMEKGDGVVLTQRPAENYGAPRPFS